MNDNSNSSAHPADVDARLARRLFRVMAAAVLLAAVLSLLFAAWRVTTGLLLGGTLSLLNLHWMRSSVAAAFSKADQGARPRIRMAQYVLRYFIIGAVVYTSYKLNVVSLAATVIGLSSFVVALFVEALRESYFIITRREGIN